MKNMNPLKFYFGSIGVLLTITIFAITVGFISAPQKTNERITHIATVGDTKIYEIIGSKGDVYVFALNQGQQISISK